MTTATIELRSRFSIADTRSKLKLGQAAMTEEEQEVGIFDAKVGIIGAKTAYTINPMTPYQFALLSSEAYSKEPSIQCAGSKLIDQFESTASGFRAVAYQGDNGDIAIAIKGTTPDVRDITADIGIASSNIMTFFSDLHPSLNLFGDSVSKLVAEKLLKSNLDQQISDGREFIEQIKAAHPNSPIMFTGHSLGGFLAQVLAQQEQNPFVTFDAPGVRADCERLGLPIHVHSESKDLVALPNLINTSGGRHIADVISLPTDKTTYTADAAGFAQYSAGSHSIAKFINALSTSTPSVSFDPQSWPNGPEDALAYYLNHHPDQKSAAITMDALNEPSDTRDWVMIGFAASPLLQALVQFVTTMSSSIMKKIFNDPVDFSSAPLAHIAQAAESGTVDGIKALSSHHKHIGDSIKSCASKAIGLISPLTTSLDGELSDFGNQLLHGDYLKDEFQGLPDAFGEISFGYEA